MKRSIFGRVCKFRRFYHSLLFWLGVPGLVFLLWVWWDCSWRQTYLYSNWGKRADAVWVRGGMLGWEGSVFKGPGSMPGTLSFSSYNGSPLGSNRAMKHEFMMSRAYEWTSDDDFDATSQSLEVAMWVVVAGYGVMWLGAVWWWQRRKARVMKSLTEVEVVS